MAECVFSQAVQISETQQTTIFAVNSNLKELDPKAALYILLYFLARKCNYKI